MSPNFSDNTSITHTSLDVKHIYENVEKNRMYNSNLSKFSYLTAMPRIRMIHSHDILIDNYCYMIPLEKQAQPTDR